MKVFVFDLLAYGAHLNLVKAPGVQELPYPLSAKHFDPKIGMQTYEEHLQAWEEMDKLGYDGVGFNEHHTSPYGLMNSPNLMAAAAAQRTKKLQLLIYGNLLPLHSPLRLAEELAMLDCLSGGRIISGFARGIPREYGVHNVPMSESRDRFEEAYEIVTGAWTQDVFSYEGKFWSYKDVALWPRPVQRPHPRVWVPVVGSKESIEWAARKDVPITPGLAPGGLRDDIIGLYAKVQAQHGRKVTPQHLSIGVNAYVADSKAQAVKENGPYHLYFNQTLFSHGNFTETAIQREHGYVTQNSTDYVRQENLKQAAFDRQDFRNMTMADVEKRAEHMPWGTADEVAAKLIAEAEKCGAETLLVSKNRGAMPHEMFLNQIRRFGQEVLPKLQAHQITRVPAAEEIMA